MNLREIVHLSCLAMVLALMCYSARAEDELDIKYVGKMDVTSVNGAEQLDVFYMTNRTTNRLVYYLYWFAKTNSHLAVATQFTNSVVDWGDRLCCFSMFLRQMIVYSGFTNVADPCSEAEIRKCCEPVFRSMIAGNGNPNETRPDLDSVLDVFSLQQRPPSYGSHIIITRTSVTATNVTLELHGVRAEYHDRIDPTDNVGVLTFGKDLKISGARVITNGPPRSLLPGMKR